MTSASVYEIFSMYGYSSNTIQYWGVEAVVTLAAALLLLSGIFHKRRFTALVFPLSRLLIRAASLIYQPSDYCYALSLDKTALLLFVSILEILMYRYAVWGYFTAVASLWMLSILWEETIDGISTYFVFGGELTFLGVECVATLILYSALAVVGFLFAETRVHPYKPLFQN